jgi:hypothetical protein
VQLIEFRVLNAFGNGCMIVCIQSESKNASVWAACCDWKELPSSNELLAKPPRRLRWERVENLFRSLGGLTLAPVPSAIWGIRS